MERIKVTFAGGLVATVLVGAMLLMNNAIHRLPRLGIGQSLASIIGLPDSVFAGWLLFVVLGVFVFSSVFAWATALIPVKTYLIKGLVFGTALWLFMMLVFEPLAGQGLFALHVGYIVAALALVLNLFYGLVMSLTYRWLLGPEANARVVNA